MILTPQTGGGSGGGAVTSVTAGDNTLTMTPVSGIGAVSIVANKSVILSLDNAIYSMFGV